VRTACFTALLERGARTSPITPALAVSPVARSICSRARVAWELGSSNAFEALKLPGAGPPITPAIANANAPTTATRRGREPAMLARRLSTITTRPWSDVDTH
jgi:hypothetical protein